MASPRDEACAFPVSHPRSCRPACKGEKWSVCGSLPASLPLTCRLTQPTSPAPHGTREGNLARTNARPAALRLRVNRVPGRVSKGWELLQSEALALVAPTQRPSPPRYPPAPLPSSPFLPSGSSSLLSCPCPSSDLFAGLTPFFSRPPKTAASVSPL